MCATKVLDPQTVNQFKPKGKQILKLYRPLKQHTPGALIGPLLSMGNPPKHKLAK